MNITELEKEAYLALKKAKRNKDSKQADKDLREFMDNNYPLTGDNSLINKEIRNNIFNLWEVWNSCTPCSPIFHFKVDTKDISQRAVVSKDFIGVNMLRKFIT
jgi:hypothetical protein